MEMLTKFEFVQQWRIFLFWTYLNLTYPQKETCKWFANPFYQSFLSNLCICTYIFSTVDVMSCGTLVSTGASVWKSKSCKLFLVVKRRIMVPGIPWTVETQGTTTQRLSVWCAHSLWTAYYTEYLIRFLIRFKGKVQIKTDLKRACSYGLHQIIRISPSMCWFG